MNYPVLEIDTELVYNNARILRELCLARQIEPTAVIKGWNGIECITEAVLKAGYLRLASSRLAHLRQVKERCYAAETMALRLPMLSELPELIAYADISLNSEYSTLKELNEEAGRQGKTHKVILMRDLGDLREGIWEGNELYRLAEQVEHTMPHLRLQGIGVNLTCYGAVRPTTENLSELVADAGEIERRLGRPLDMVSGGATSTLPLLIKGGLPQGLNDLRIGEALIVPCDLQGYWGCDVPGLSNRTLLLRAQIIECGEKPTLPKGQSGHSIFSNKFKDRGRRRRALLALGLFDVGDFQVLQPLDPDIEILGGSSDHLIIDIHESRKEYRLGDIVDFELHYKAMVFTTANPLVKKVRVK